MKCLILENKKCSITSSYGQRKLNGKYDYHHGIDIVKEGYKLDYIVAHSDGVVVYLVDNKNNNKGSGSYGNYVKIKHNGGYSTLYAHLEKGILVKKGEKIKKGKRIGYMGDSGDAYGKHLHFEVWNNNSRIDPTRYLYEDLPIENNKINIKKYKHEIGEKVIINGVYKSSFSKERLTPLISEGKITNIINGVPNPYLIENGKIGWINDNCIIESTKYLSNFEYKGDSIVDGLNQIEVDSSYNYRKKLALLNNVENYKGTAEQNTYLLILLKLGMLKY